MTVMLHPNRTCPKRLRVYDKELGIQEYFSFAQYGEEKAWKLANERQKTIDYRKHVRKLSRELAINKLFDEEGKVIGMRRFRREREGRKPYEYLMVQATVAPGQQKKKEISLAKRDFEVAYKLAQDALMALHGIERTPEITQAFAKAKRHYW